MPFIPGIPDRHVVITVCPVHAEQAETALLEYLHAVGFYGDLGVGTLGPVFQQLFCVFFSYYDDVQGLAGPEITDGHSM